MSFKSTTRLKKNHIYRTMIYSSSNNMEQYKLAKNFNDQTCCIYIRSVPELRGFPGSLNNTHVLCIKPWISQEKINNHSLFLHFCVWGDLVVSSSSIPAELEINCRHQQNLKWEKWSSWGATESISSCYPSLRALPCGGCILLRNLQHASEPCVCVFIC